MTRNKIDSCNKRFKTVARNSVYKYAHSVIFYISSTFVFFQLFLLYLFLFCLFPALCSLLFIHYILPFANVVPSLRNGSFYFSRCSTSMRHLLLIIIIYIFFSYYSFSKPPYLFFYFLSS